MNYKFKFDGEVYHHNRSIPLRMHPCLISDWKEIVNRRPRKSIVICSFWISSVYKNSHLMKKYNADIYLEKNKYGNNNPTQYYKISIHFDSKSTYFLFHFVWKGVLLQKAVYLQSCACKCNSPYPSLPAEFLVHYMTFHDLNGIL